MWTDAMNKKVIRFYFIATEMETKMINYTTDLLELFSEKYPRFNNRMTEPKLIERKKYLKNKNNIYLTEIN